MTQLQCTLMLPPVDHLVAARPMCPPLQAVLQMTTTLRKRSLMPWPLCPPQRWLHAVHGPPLPSTRGQAHRAYRHRILLLLALLLMLPLRVRPPFLALMV